MERTKFLAELAELDRTFSSLQPELELTVRDPEEGVEGYVVVWSTLTAKGGPLGRCGKGGTRITPTLSLDEVKMLARTMTLKNSAAGLPLGGSKSGLRADPDAPGFERRYRRFVQLVKPVLRENGGIFGGFGFDIGGKPIHARWACDELKSLRCFTGKPLEMGGTDYDREGIAGLGVAHAALQLLEHRKERPQATIAAIQGLGAMGAAVLRYFTENGGQIGAISDPRIGGTVVFGKSFPAKVRDELFGAVIAQDFEKARSLLEAARISLKELDDVLYEQCDILFPCAIQNVITPENVAMLRCRYVVEGANSPCTPEARSQLQQRKIVVVPDFIANPGGIIAAFVEMTATISAEENVRTRKNVDDAKALTISKIRANTASMLELADAIQAEPVEVGRYMALKNILSKGNF
jgi:glutamate dehydrogenase (NAD(P)+)